MREIKFRAWDSVKRNMMQIGDFPLYHEPDNGLHSGWSGEGGDWDSHVLMQYTGLKDKNGVEIYEGDILSMLVEDGYICQVTWNDKTAVFCCKYKDHQKFNNSDHLYGAELCEVIGNIYQNPELLEE